MQEERPENLPVDLDTLKAMLRQRDQVIAERDRVIDQNKQVIAQREQAIAQREQVIAERDRVIARSEQVIDHLRAELLRLRKQIYGPRADKLKSLEELADLIADVAAELSGQQPAPTAEDASAINDEPAPLDLSRVTLADVRKLNLGQEPVEEKSASHRGAKKDGKGRRRLGNIHDLPLTKREYDLPEGQKPCACCGRMRTRIGSDSSFTIELIPEHFERIEHIRHKYACTSCNHDCEKCDSAAHIDAASRPASPIGKGLAGPGLLSRVVVGKFSDYLPFYRIEDQFERAGFWISRATISVWCIDIARLLQPLYDLMVRRVLQSHVIHTDDTTMPLLSPGLGKTRTARFWCYVGDEDHPYNLFDFRLSRNRDGPIGFLKDYKQVLVSDGYSGYDPIVTSNQITRAGCWAHVRRKFIDREAHKPDLAKQAVEWIGQLYAIEKHATKENLSREARLTLRGEQSLPILKTLKAKLEEWKSGLLPKHAMQEAVGYALNQWNELNVFATDGAVAIDNNLAEREMKRVVLSRKASLFVGSQAGGHAAAVLSSLTSSCKRQEIDPQQYLTQLLTNARTLTPDQWPAWLPDEWKKRTS